MQSSHTLQWAKTLRSRSPSPSAHHERRQHGAPKATGGESQLSKSADFTGSIANGSAKVGRALSGSAVLARSNEEYIMSLQQQVHFLEMDAARVRLEAQAATEMHPKMTAEAERMLGKLRELQVSVDDLTLQLQRVEAEIEHAVGDRNIINTRLDSEISLRAKDRQVLAQEVALARKGKEDAAIDGVRKDSLLRETLEKNEELRHVLRQVEERNVELSTVLDQRAEEHCLTLIALEEKVAHLALASNHLASTKLRYAESTALSRDKTVSKLKAEVQLLRCALGIPTASVATAAPALTKQGTRALTLTEENGLLRERTVELQTRITMEKNLRNSMTLQLEQETAEVARLYARTKELLLQLQLQQAPIGSPRQQWSTSNNRSDAHVLRNDGRQDHAMLYKGPDSITTTLTNRRAIDVLSPSGYDIPGIQEQKLAKRLDDENASKQRKSTSFSDLTSPGNRRALKRDDAIATEAKEVPASNGTGKGTSGVHSGQRQSSMAPAEATASTDRAAVQTKTSIAAKTDKQSYEISTGSEVKNKQIKIDGTSVEQTANQRRSDGMDQPKSDATERTSLHDLPAADGLPHRHPAASESSRPLNVDRATTVAAAKSTGEINYVQIDVPLIDAGHVNGDKLLSSDRSTVIKASTAEAKQPPQQSQQPPSPSPQQQQSQQPPSPQQQQSQPPPQQQSQSQQQQQPQPRPQQQPQQQQPQQQQQQQPQQQQQQQQQQQPQPQQQPQQQQELLSERANKKELMLKQSKHKSLPPSLQQETRDSESETTHTDMKEQHFDQKSDQQKSDRESVVMAPARRRSFNDDLVLARQQQKQIRHQAKQASDQPQQQ